MDNLYYICRIIISNKYINKMIIARKRVAEWKSLKEQGDIDKIAELAKVHRTTVSTVFKSSRGSEPVIAAIEEFYKNRKIELA